MPTLTPTKDTGSVTKPGMMLTAEPGRVITDAQLHDQTPDTGMNGAFIADYLSAMLTHERCSLHLYRSVAGRSLNPILQRKYEQFGAETLRHVEILERVVSALGGNPSYVSPQARAVQLQDTKLVESTYLGPGSADPMTLEMAMLDAVFIGETICHANWSTLGTLCEQLPEGPARNAVQEAVDEVEDEEDEHVEWARSTRTRLVTLTADSSMLAGAAATLEGVVARIKGWFA